MLLPLGVPGCGKSTPLRLIAGFERPTEGTITVSGAPPEPEGVVFQQPRLVPWRTVGGNVDLALAASTPLLLLDEPFAALDALTRERLQDDVRAVSHETGRTSVFVTHSADEAVFLGSRVVVLTARPGQIALDLRIDLPRSGVDPEELRGSPEFAALRAEVGSAVKAAAHEA